jgi:ribosomal protein S27E
MRLSDMHRMHPEQITSHCSKCGHEVGIYPSGQRVLKEHPSTRIICQICRGDRPDIAILAPGAEHEILESKDRKE